MYSSILFFRRKATYSMKAIEKIHLAPPDIFLVNFLFCEFLFVISLVPQLLTVPQRKFLPFEPIGSY